ncbi:hypothetical protein GCM10027425_09400 [Alteromonas gracilis]
MDPNPERRARVLLATFTMAFGLVAVGGVLGAVWWWGVGFDEAEARGMATRSTDAAMVASFWTAVAGSTGLLVTGFWAAARHGRKRS